MTNSAQFRKDQVVAALGASAGGLEPLEKFFQAMPPDSGVSFVIIQHLSPDHPSALTDLIGRFTKMQIEQAKDNTRPEPNRVYIIPPNATLTIEHGLLRVSPPAQARGFRTPIDAFFSSLAEDRGEHAVCIMLSGTGSDGTIGLRAIKEHGGMAMAQSLDTAKYDAILRSAINTGLVDYVLPVEEMPARLIEYAQHISDQNRNPEGLRAQIAPHLAAILELIRRRSGHDFSQYKDSTIIRRISRRMNAAQIELAEDYLELLNTRPEEIDLLLGDLLIGVTQFFRDTEAFESLERDVIPRLFAGKDESTPVRACIVGCATGEEAYSIAMLLSEFASTLPNPPKLQLFATDIDERSLEVARKGHYPLSVAQNVREDRLLRFFTKDDDSYVVKRELREICIFSRHSFIKDPPFTRLDLISCRNVMIYMGAELQKKVFPLFHYALRPNGFLFLGPSESPGSHSQLFEPIDKVNRLFLRKETHARSELTFPLSNYGRYSPGSNPPLPEVQDLNRQLERIILGRFRPACVAVRDNGDGIYFSGPTSKYLELPSGSPDTNVVNLAQDGLKTPLRSCLRKASTSRTRVVEQRIPVHSNGSESFIDLSVEPILGIHGADLFMVTFEPSQSSHALLDSPKVPGNAYFEEIIDHLEDDLRAAQEHAQAVYEELESSNEELKSANEEFQSTNEELESSKEELQSFNEELQTVNAELNRKVGELDLSNSDLQNLLNATQIATVFLGTDLRIKNYTPSAGSVFSLIKGDIGRPFTDLATHLHDARLETEINEVLRTLAVCERQLETNNGRFYQMRILPYRTVHDVIDGVVMTFVDVTELRQLEALAQSIVDTVQNPLLVLDANYYIQSASKAFNAEYGLPKESVVKKSLFELSQRRWDTAEIRDLLNSLLKRESPTKDCQVAFESQTEGTRTLQVNGSLMDRKKLGEPLILLSIRDITEKQQVEVALRRSESRYRTLFDSIDDGYCIIELEYDKDGKAIDYKFLEVSPSFEKHTGLKDVKGKFMRSLVPGIEPEWIEAYGQVALIGEPLRMEANVQSMDRWFDIYAFRFGPPDHHQVGVIFRDISASKSADEALRCSEEKFRTLFEASPVALFVFDEHALIQDYNAQAEVLLGRPLEIKSEAEKYFDKACLAHMRAVLESGNPEKNIDYALVRSNGSITPCIANYFPLFEVKGAISGLIVSFADVTELKRVQKRLESLNLDLQQFSFAASHDLQQPLRMVTSYTQLLAQQYKGKLDAEADMYIGYAVRGAEQMEILLRDLREYWWVSRRESEQFVLVDCQHILDQSLQALSMALTESKGVVTHGPLPSILAEETPLLMLFQNLISNSLKYARPGEPPLVHITATQDESRWTFSFADNGIGIEQQHLLKIFAPFKRLHGSEYAGSGMGLAITKSIVERYGGSIWAESEFGKGSTFRFTFPLVKDGSHV